jgi:hypothetical protein
MNQRIRELVEKAPYTTVSTEGRLFTQQDLAKFAELIVKECADFLKDTLDDHFAAEQLKEHFSELNNEYA